MTGLRTRLIGGMAAGLLWVSPMPAADILPAMAAEAVEAPAVQGRVVSLEECLQMALGKQPNIDAARASLAAAESNRRALKKIPVPDALSRELSVRRTQSELGVTIAAAQVDLAEQETVYAVVRSYYTVLFAQAQKQVADIAVQKLNDIYAPLKKAVDDGEVKELNKSDVSRTGAYLGLARSRQIEAQQGVQRALAALREAIGVGPDCCLSILDTPWPEPVVLPCRGDIVGMAVNRRGEVLQTVTFAEVTSLEVKAQSSHWSMRAATFAAGGDIHSKAIPTSDRTDDYRPGALAPEYPPYLVGCRKSRVERANDLFARANAVADKTRNLIALEAEDVYLKYQEAAERIARTRGSIKEAGDAAKDSFERFSKLNKEYKPVLEDTILEAKASAQYNEARFQLVIYGAALERITAGGWCSGLAAPLKKSP